MSPTQRSLAKLRAEGWRVAIVEHWNAFTKQRNDMWGILDLVAIRTGETLGVQTTSASNVSARVKKIEDSEALPWLREAGWGVQVWGWRKNSKGKWVCSVKDLS